MMFSRPALLVVGAATYHGAHARVGRREHRVARPRVVVPTAVRLEVHVGELPDLPRVVDPALEPSCLLVGADLQPVLEQDDAGVDHRFLDGRHLLQEPLGLLGRAEAHHPLDARAVVPAAVEDHDLAGRREVRGCTAGCTSATSRARSGRGARRPGTRGGSPAR